jgi:hypothetical protein
MATTTTNFGWDIPQSTDLVKDGATAIAALGQDIDTAMVDLKGGTTGQVLAKASGTDLDFSWVAQDDSNAIQNAIVDAKGDLIAATAADTPARLAVGTNGQLLTADSTAATGLAWATVSSGGMTLLSTTTLSGSSTSISITPTGYNEIQIIVSGVSNGSNGNLFMRINSDTTTANYVQAFYSTEGTAYYSGANVGVDGVNAIIPGQAGYLGANSNNIAQFTMEQPNSANRKLVTAQSAFFSGSSLHAASNTTCNYVTTSALSSVQLFTTVGSFTAGTVLVYGVK